MPFASQCYTGEAEALSVTGALAEMPIDVNNSEGDIEFSKHALGALRERSIPEEWVRRTVNSPDRAEAGAENTIHYIKAIPEHEGRFLRVVVNPHVGPKRVIAVFFDRRLGRQS